MKRGICLMLLLVSPIVPSAHATFIIDQATFEAADAGQPALASSPDGLTMLAYHADEEFILMSFVRTLLLPTLAADPQDWPLPQTMNSGSAPTVCWSREGFTLAFASGDAVLVYQSDPLGNWDLVNFEIFFPGGPVLGIDLWGAAYEGSGPHVYLVVSSSLDPPDGDNRVHFASRTEFGWSELTLIAEELDVSPRARVTWSLGGYGPRPTVLYLGRDSGVPALMSRSHDGLSWSPAIAVPLDPMPVGGAFDVVTHGVGARNVLGLGPELDCPCGTIHHLATNPSGIWTTVEDLTVPYGYMDLPLTPRLGADPEERVHALWYQQMSDEQLEPQRRDLEYWIREGSVWTDAGAFLDGQAGGPLQPDLALDVSAAGDVVMAWTRRDTVGGVPQLRQVWIARPLDPSGVLDENVPRAPIRLDAWPNPFNPRVTLGLETVSAGPVDLSIYDARGRCMCHLLAGELAAGRRELIWDGTDDNGREVPSGVYFARAVSACERVVHKLALVR